MGAEHMFAAAFIASGQQLERTAPVGLRKAAATAIEITLQIAPNAF
jgi:hypothetical protein